MNFPDLEPDELLETCTLDVADDGAHTLEEIADLMNLTRERVRQLETIAISKLRRVPEVVGLMKAHDARSKAATRAIDLRANPTAP